MQVKENRGITAFYILWGSLEIHSTYGSKGMYTSLFPPANVPSEPQIWLPWPSISRSANRSCVWRRILGFSDSIYAWRGLFQARWSGDPPSSAEGQHNPGSLHVRKCWENGLWGTHHSSHSGLGYPYSFLAYSQWRHPVLSTHLVQVFRNVTQSG